MAAGTAVLDAPTQIGITPVRYTNVRFPNQIVLEHVDPQVAKRPNFDPAIKRELRFLNGSFLATEPWQIDAIERLPHIYKDDSPTAFTCPLCNFSSYSSEAYGAHMAREAS